MLRVADGRLPAAHERKLEEYQSDVDGKGTYEKRVAEGKRLFKSRNSKRNGTFKAVRKTLSVMCRGPRRCMYCEDSAADEVEHFRPKDLYPEAVFVWMNYLYACGRTRCLHQSRESIDRKAIDSPRRRETAVSGGT